MATTAMTIFFLGMIVGGILTALTGAWLAYLYDRHSLRHGEHTTHALQEIKHRIRKKG